MNISKHDEEIIAYCILNTLVVWVIYLIIGYLFSVFIEGALFFDFLVNPLTWVLLGNIVVAANNTGITSLALPKNHQTSNETKKIICTSIGISMGITMGFFGLLLLVLI